MTHAAQFCYTSCWTKKNDPHMVTFKLSMYLLVCTFSKSFSVAWFGWIISSLFMNPSTKLFGEKHHNSLQLVQKKSIKIKNLMLEFFIPLQKWWQFCRMLLRHLLLKQICEWHNVFWLTLVTKHEKFHLAKIEDKCRLVSLHKR